MNNDRVNVIVSEHNSLVDEEMDSFRAARVEVQRIRLSAQRELELARQIRAEAERYRQETEAKARSQAQLLILQARLSIQKEVTELKRKAGEEIQQILVDIRMIRITAQEELEAQRKFNTASRIRTLSHSSQKKTGHKSERAAKAVSVRIVK